MAYIRTKKVKGKEYKYLVEGYRDKDGKVKQALPEFPWSTLDMVCVQVRLNRCYWRNCSCLTKAVSLREAASLPRLTAQAVSRSAAVGADRSSARDKYAAEVKLVKLDSRSLVKLKKVVTSSSLWLLSILGLSRMVVPIVGILVVTPPGSRD